jgi:hypothetical protein
MSGTLNNPPSDGHLIWYAGYGSNLSRARFNCGGTPEGSTRTYPGCRDKTPHRPDRKLKLPHQPYFAGHSNTWNAAVAFIRPTPPNATTYAHVPHHLNHEDKNQKGQNGNTKQRLVWRVVNWG